MTTGRMGWTATTMRATRKEEGEGSMTRVTRRGDIITMPAVVPPLPPLLLRDQWPAVLVVDPQGAGGGSTCCKRGVPRGLLLLLLLQIYLLRALVAPLL